MLRGDLSFIMVKKKLTGHWFPDSFFDMALPGKVYKPFSKTPSESKAPPANVIRLLIPNRNCPGLKASQAIKPKAIRTTLMMKTMFVGAVNLIVKHSFLIVIGYCQHPTINSAQDQENPALIFLLLKGNHHTLFLRFGLQEWPCLCGC